MALVENRRGLCCDLPAELVRSFKQSHLSLTVQAPSEVLGQMAQMTQQFACSVDLLKDLLLL